jgi:hypothetical protein
MAKADPEGRKVVVAVAVCKRKAARIRQHSID